MSWWVVDIFSEILMASIAVLIAVFVFAVLVSILRVALRVSAGAYCGHNAGVVSKECVPLDAAEGNGSGD